MLIRSSRLSESLPMLYSIGLPENHEPSAPQPDRNLPTWLSARHRDPYPFEVGKRNDGAIRPQRLATVDFEYPLLRTGEREAGIDHGRKALRNHQPVARAIAIGHGDPVVVDLRDVRLVKPRSLAKTRFCSKSSGVKAGIIGRKEASAAASSSVAYST